MKNCYTLTTRYNECCQTGQNWVGSFTTLRDAIHQLTCELGEHSRYTQGTIDDDGDLIDDHLWFDADGDLVLDTDRAHEFIDQTFECGDYLLTLAKV
jgi:hypothetical protein